MDNGFTRRNLVSLAIILSILFAGVRSENRASSRSRRSENDDYSYCESWKFTVENAVSGGWSIVPRRCKEYIKNYMTGGRYLSDSEFVANDSIAFAKNVTLAGDGKDCWIFDADETLFWNYPFYKNYAYGVEAFNKTAGEEWTERGVAPALPPSLRLYNELRHLKFTIIVLTGRTESLRNITVKNLLFAGYKNWSKLLLRGPSDVGTSATVYKSNKRRELEAEGFRIHGSSGDQWSDLLGSPMAVRSFKLPNPMYYVT